MVEEANRGTSRLIPTKNLSLNRCALLKIDADAARDSRHPLQLLT